MLKIHNSLNPLRCLINFFQLSNNCLIHSRNRSNKRIKYKRFDNNTNSVSIYVLRSIWKKKRIRFKHFLNYFKNDDVSCRTTLDFLILSIRFVPSNDIKNRKEKKKNGNMRNINHSNCIRKPREKVRPFFL